MKAGSLVRVVRQDPYDPRGTELDAPVWDAGTLGIRGWVRHGDVFVVARTDLRKYGRGLASAGWTGDAEIIHPEWGAVLIEGAYLEVVDESR